MAFRRLKTTTYTKNGKKYKFKAWHIEFRFRDSPDKKKIISKCLYVGKTWDKDKVKAVIERAKREATGRYSFDRLTWKINLEVRKNGTDIK